MASKVQIKGIREGLLVVLEDGVWEELRPALLLHLDQQVEFLRGARLALDVGSQALKAVELSKLRDDLSERGLTLWAIVSKSPTTEKTAQALGLATRIDRPRAERVQPAMDTSIQGGEPAVLLRRTLRSGYSVHFDGHVIVIGDVNPGAEIIAGGDVIVWGHLRGMVHAGANGKEDSVVCALDLAPTQLRIGDQIAIPPKRRGKPQPEMAVVSEGQVIAKQWFVK